MTDHGRGPENGSKENLSLTSPKLSATTGTTELRSRSPTIRTPSATRRPMNMPSPNPSHRHSFSSESFRGVPASPRASRNFSLSNSGVLDLLNNPPKAGAADPMFEGRDWQGITVQELIDPKELKFVDMDTGVEQATNMLIESTASVLLIRSNARDKSAIGTFDYKDLNQYLLFATGGLQPTEEQLSFFQDLARRAEKGHPIPLRDAKALGPKEPFVVLSHTENLTKAVELFGGGVHRLIIVKEGSSDVIGVLSQSRLVKFLWENGRSFPTIDQLYPQTLRDLGIGSTSVIYINGDRPLQEALKLMDTEGVTSLAVLDSSHNVIGNISTSDVQLLTKASSAPLLENTCIHFISIILSTRGLTDGKDSFPVFYISPYSTLAHTVAKLVATRSHRMWIVESPSPGGSGPPTPSLAPTTVHPPSSYGGQPTATPPMQGQQSSSTPTVSASALPGQHMSGRLSGVVSLTDVLNLFARASGLHPNDPMERRRHRRRSSSSSFVRGSSDSARSSSVDVSRRG
ncbi:cell separation during budding [Agyrium rufum]|nr:cell separation during budding [Agyrium rufum]